jgi:DSF synthase
MAMRCAFTNISSRASSDPIGSLTHAVLKSAHPCVFSLGGDLGLFADAIERQAPEPLRRYGAAAADLVLWGEETDEAPVSTIALVQGDAFGGGLEAARACHVVVAEVNARLGLPESGFGLFPGMGAYLLMRHYAGHAFAERMIVSGDRFSAEEMHRAGIVDVLVNEGEGEEAIRALIRERMRSPRAAWSVRELRRHCQPLDARSLKRNVDLWVKAAMSVDAAGLRRMKRFAQSCCHATTGIHKVPPQT